MATLALPAPVMLERIGVGRIFLVVAFAWFAGAFWLMRPDLSDVSLVPATPVRTVDYEGHKYRVYTPEEVFGLSEAGRFDPLPPDPAPQYTIADFIKRPLIRFLAVSMVPPLLLMLTLFFIGWLADRAPRPRPRT